MKKRKILNLNLRFNEESKNFEIEFETYRHQNGVCFPQDKTTEKIDMKIINRLIRIMEDVSND
jgi:hypothetical protein